MLKLRTKIQLNEHSVEVAIKERRQEEEEATTISVPANLIRRGNELKIVVSPDNRSPARVPDPVLVKLLGQAFAARDHLLEGHESEVVSDYSRRHLQKLARLSWLAPDIVSDILEGRQPPHLTGRHLLRCGVVPLDWRAQREFLGFT